LVESPAIISKELYPIPVSGPPHSGLRPASDPAFWGLDKLTGSNKMGIPAVFMEPLCQHSRTEVIARRDGVDYFRCLDCHQILEEEDLEPVPAPDDEEQGS